MSPTWTSSCRMRTWSRCGAGPSARAFAPEAIYRRFRYNQEHTYPHRIEIPPTGKLKLANLWRGLTTLAKLMVKVGMLSDYRDVFWRMAKPALKSGDIETVIHVSLVVAPHDFVCSRGRGGIPERFVLFPEAGADGVKGIQRQV